MGAQFSHDFEAEWPALAGQLHGMLSNKGIPRFKRDDLVQETGLRLFKMWDHVDPDRPVWPLAVTIALNLLRDEARKRPGREVLGDVPDAATDHDVEREGLARMELRRVCRAMADLSPAHRSILLVELGEGKGEPARGQAASKMLRLRARKKLHAALESASAGSIAVIFRARRLLETGAQVAFGRPWTATGHEAAAAGVFIVAALSLAGLPGSADAGPSGRADAARAPAAIAALDAQPATTLAAGGAVLDAGDPLGAARAPAGHRDDATRRGREASEDDGSVEVPVPVNGMRISGRTTVRVLGYGASVQENPNGTPACIHGTYGPVPSSYSCADQSSGTKIEARVVVEPGGGNSIQAGFSHGS